MEKRNTVQKKFVLDAVTTLANHPTAENVYEKVSSIYPTISKATVYRNLSGLSDDGFIRHIQMPGGADRFDFNVSMPHNHIVCKACGAFEDAPMIESEGLDMRVSEKTGFANVTHEIVYTGVCKECARNNKN